MKIGSKLILFYSSLTFSIALFIIVLFYVSTSNYIDSAFNANLCDKAILSAQRNLEKDAVDIRTYQLIEQKYKALLPGAKEIILNDSDRTLLHATLNKFLTPKQQNNLYSGDPITFTKGNLCGAALNYPVDKGNYIILVTAHNKYGYKIQEHTLYLSSILLLISLAIIILMGKIYSDRILEPLKHILSHLKTVKGNNINVRLKETGNRDELDALVHSLNEMLGRIEEAFKSEKSFVSAASHELNNPLTAIQGECEVTLMKERSKEEYVESLQRISTESQRLSQLIKHLLFLSHHDEDLSSLEQSSINLHDFLSEMAQTTERVLFTDFTDGLFCMQANAYLLKTALQNFLNNAVKYSTKQIDLRLKMYGVHPMIEVEDYGIGIPKEDADQIFQPFFRASNVRGYGGTGVGLALAEKILTLYHAKISLETEQGVHTKFTIVFLS